MPQEELVTNKIAYNNANCYRKGAHKVEKMPKSQSYLLHYIIYLQMIPVKTGGGGGSQKHQKNF